MKKITHALLLRILNYNASSGLFSWRAARKGVRVGSIAGSDDGDGYIRIKVCQKYYRASRLAWFYVYGRWPANEIDHRNGIRIDNRIENLRDVSIEENRQNLRRPHHDNRSKFLGVAFHKRDGTWNAAIKHEGRSIHLGCFSSAQLAHRAYVKAKRRLHPGCTI